MFSIKENRYFLLEIVNGRSFYTVNKFPKVRLERSLPAKLHNDELCIVPRPNDDYKITFKEGILQLGKYQVKDENEKSKRRKGAKGPNDTGFSCFVAHPSNIYLRMKITSDIPKQSPIKLEIDLFFNDHGQITQKHQAILPGRLCSIRTGSKFFSVPIEDYQPAIDYPSPSPYSELLLLDPSMLQSPPIFDHVQTETFNLTQKKLQELENLKIQKEMIEKRMAELEFELQQPHTLYLPIHANNDRVLSIPENSNNQSYIDELEKIMSKEPDLEKELDRYVCELKHASSPPFDPLFEIITYL
eukprot:TRINITY_DN42105_c0_g1_i1.p1 TRINITY_DN42105_c0_g1~~TRINITY_DN42105_c0_g1_i1.p1  ORF type:complete len:301 (-),score=21.08 TRINITY_DN42105_c0_g1_i1:16-918(-)